MSIYEKLLNIQTELKAPKGQYNSFGKYKYRSCEDILEAVKPICAKNKATLVLSDTLEYIGDRYYIKSQAKLIDVENGTEVNNTAYAREEENKKGMDGSQITGTASSYARKYALNGLFNIDDTKDADTDEYANQNKKLDDDVQEEWQVDEPKIDSITKAEALSIYNLMVRKGLNVIAELQKNYGIDNTEKLTKAQYLSILKVCQNLPDKKVKSINDI